MTKVVQVRSGAYHDSVSLMLVSRGLQARADVRAALVAMATDLNLEMLASMGFEPPGTATPNDLLVAVDTTGSDGASTDEVIVAVDEALVGAPGSHSSVTTAGAPPARTVGAAARRTKASVALISTPGRFATIDAADALDSGLDVMLFSDNVGIDDEVRLKERADALGRLVMGPDCGTAVLDGVGLGFANVVRPGPVGIVAASGTGAQHLMALLAGAGIGTAQCLGVGGRDLSSAVGGRSTLTALDRLADDDGVTTIVVVSKPPDDDVAQRVSAHARSTGKQVVLGYLGPGRPDLTATAQAVATSLGFEWTSPGRWGAEPPRTASGSLRGLFVGGTLCYEALVVAAERLGRVASNLALPGQPALDDGREPRGHTLVDFGADEFTRGRPHPMIDGSLRSERLAAELADPTCGVVLLDVVLGHGVEPDPVADLLAPIAGSDKPVVACVVGTAEDPQDLDATVRRLVDAGAVVHASNAAAAREAAALVSGGSA